LIRFLSLIRLLEKLYFLISCSFTSLDNYVSILDFNFKHQLVGDQFFKIFIDINLHIVDATGSLILSLIQYLHELHSVLQLHLNDLAYLRRELNL
jgi:hypothetical protein